MSHISRRTFLRNAAAVSAAFAGLHRFTKCTENIQIQQLGYGPLQSASNGWLDLPAGFNAQIIARTGQTMADSLLRPGQPDGMAAFTAKDDKTILICNHELESAHGPFGPNLERLSQVPPHLIYDRGHNKPAMGGTTTLVYDTKKKRVDNQYLSLSGTRRNCAGGPTPWNSWLSCEEDVAVIDNDWQQDHGYVFEVPASSAAQLTEPVPLKSMGRFVHEAVAVDPGTGIVYQTEDRNDGCIYRYVPNEYGHLASGGRLQALGIREQKAADLRNWPDGAVTPFPVGVPTAVSWIDLDDIQSPANDLRKRAFTAGAAQFARGEGMWFGRQSVFFACTNGGTAKLGQIFRYTPSPYEATAAEMTKPGALELFLESNDDAISKNADNLTVAPWGDLLICEDCSGVDRLIGITPRGETYLLARNAHNESELAGCCFSPDGSTLFVNIQDPGITFAITGPWRSQHFAI